MNISERQKRSIKGYINGIRGRKGLRRGIFFNLGLFNIALAAPLEFFLLREAIDAESFLDLGCGRHSFAAVLPDDIYSVGVDMFEPYLRESSQNRRHKGYIRADIRALEMKDKSFDVVMLLDVLEHLTMDEGIDLIARAERWAKRKTIIFTPNGFLAQDEYDDNPYQTHRSGWVTEDFTARGYRVYGIKGLKRSGPLDKRSSDGGTLGNVLTNLPQVVTCWLPRAAYQLFCVKDVDKALTRDEE